MTLLGQQEAFTPEPTRRLIVPKGCTAYWGIDSSVRRIAVGFADTFRWDARTLVLPGGSGPVTAERLGLAFASIRDQVAAAVALDSLPRPGLVWTEQPGGKTPNLPLIYMIGVVQGAVWAGLQIAEVPQPRYETCPPGHWKKLACGSGAIWKPTRDTLGRRPEFMDYGVAVWARQNGYLGDSWDEADALGLAEAARREVLLEER